MAQYKHIFQSKSILRLLADEKH